MNNIQAITLIERAWDRGFSGQSLGRRPKRYALFVEDNTIVYSKLEKGEEELFHLCLSCFTLDREFIESVTGEDADPHLVKMVLLSPEDRISYLVAHVASKSPLVAKAIHPTVL